MKLNELPLGAPIEIYIKRDGYNYKIISKVELVKGDGICVIPIASRIKLFRFLDSDAIDITYRLDDRMWKWSQVKAGVITLEDGTALHSFSADSEAKQYNRRSAYRFPIKQETVMKYEKLVEQPEGDYYSGRNSDMAIDFAINNALMQYEIVECPCFIRDISENGAAVLSDEKLKEGDVILFELPFRGDTVVCKAVIVRAMPDKRGYYDNFYGCVYTETSRNYINFFYEVQRQSIQNDKKSRK